MPLVKQQRSYAHMVSPDEIQHATLEFVNYITSFLELIDGSIYFNVSCFSRTQQSIKVDSGLFKEIFELHKWGGLGDGSPPAGSRGGAPVGGLPEAEAHFRFL